MNKLNFLKYLSAAAIMTLASCESDETLSSSLDGSQESNLSSKSVELSIEGIQASEEQSANPARYAIDNDDTSRWSGYGDEVELVLDLGSENAVDYLQMAFLNGHQRKNYFTYYYSSNGSDWTGGKSKTSSGDTSELQIFDLENTSSTRYIMLVFAGTSTGLWNSVLDIEVYGTPGEGSDSSTPVSGSYVSIPALIQAEDYSTQSGTRTEATTDNDGGRNVGYIDNGDYLTYNIDVPTTGEYKIDFRVASRSNDSEFDVYQGDDKLTSIDKEVTGGWQTWKTTSKTVSLDAGKQTITVSSTVTGWNLNWIEFTLVGSDVSDPADDIEDAPVSGNASDPYDLMRNCKQWKITYPDGGEVKDLCNEDNNEYYYVNDDKNAIVFRAPIRSSNGTTPNSSYIRSELRERTEDGKSDIFWTTDGSHVVYSKQAITHLPTEKDHLVATQIHGNKADGIDDSMVLRLEGKHLFLSFNGGKLRDDLTIKTNYSLGAVHEVIFEVVDGKHYCYYSEDGNLGSSFLSGNASKYLVKDGSKDYVMDLDYDQTYFKIGNYTQSNAEEEGSQTDKSDNYGEVLVYDFWVQHED